jgi:acyl-coenzyme A synthetase/AMP-(fatty) acid ligase
MISHRASLTFVNWASECFDLRPSDRVSNHAPLHFDLSTFDIFAAVKAGATMVPVPEELSVFPMNMADFIERQGITTWYSVPSVLTRLVLHSELGTRDFSSLRQILFAGEVFPTKYLRQLMAAIPHAGYFNLYGPTETNVCTFYQVGELPPGGDEPIPIGRACANTEVFAVNERSELAGTDEVGELYVRGPSLMKGYWAMPERSAEALVPNPLGSPRWAERVYRTGDLVTRTAEGDYRFVGRRDSMVKSRGYRIELGEIETALYAHPDVQEAAVLAIPDDEIGNVIHAVVVTRAAAPLSAAQLQRYCGERIPRYMIPSAIHFRDALPKTSTGKVDKPALLRERVEGRR